MSLPRIQITFTRQIRYSNRRVGFMGAEARKNLILIFDFGETSADPASKLQVAASLPRFGYSSFSGTPHHASFS
jgi:hypothetical protein